jgi:hypothetical protein
MDTFFALLLSERQSPQQNVMEARPRPDDAIEQSTIQLVSALMGKSFGFLHPERITRLIEGINQLAVERGLSHPRKIPLNQLYQLILMGAREENDVLQDRWIKLLINTADNACLVEVRRAMSSILEDLSELDLLLLEIVYSKEIFPNDESELWTTFLPLRVTDTKPEIEPYRPAHHIEISLGNLARLGLIGSAMAYGGFTDLSCIHRTIFGREFLSAVSKLN